ncbi:MAG TPA: CbtA family protein [Amaricoccus sp.]|uniref:CbtA family protein n=1 Tax=Amaricoccus sp. TaxID=1872485 RepID=UPI002CFF4ED6|nr:CbtA family protein [Amaricoccus sp.]HMQ93115.1 CbtA family protein [Amaricoccus sp.]HMR53902.1 CbtA family protein [Amaricoccus sp.]HMR60293.1 CbtA family protein [Amaricoccus sp.]HMU00927.1 CbtA family protein [Amaricoccus sp.]
MLTRILFSALVAGIVAGICVAILQQFTTTPLIIEAERYEVATAQAPHFAWGSDTGEARLILAQAEAPEAHAHEHGGDDEWAPEDGLPRTFFTSIGTIGTTFGFGLILLSLMVLAAVPITARNGLTWGLVAFVCAGLAPALGLAPELPGSAAAELVSRQIWWVGTAIATAAGLWLALLVSTPAAILGGVALILAPHVIGAPHPHELTSAVPSELSGHFAAASLVVHAVAWSLTGLLAGLAWERGIGARA